MKQELCRSYNKFNLTFPLLVPENVLVAFPPISSKKLFRLRTKMIRTYSFIGLTIITARRPT